MIVFDLCCSTGHRFEGWFGSSADYAEQRDRGLIACPQCGAVAVDKAPMAPAVPRKSSQRDPVPVAGSAPSAPKQAVANTPIPPEVAQALRKLADAQTKALANSTWVGDRFAEKSRAMHYGEQDAEAIHGRASVEEAQALVDEGIAVAPLPFPIAPPDELN